MKQTLTLLVLFTSGFFFTAFSQTWTNFQTFGGTGTEICSGLALDKDRSAVLAGSFKNQIVFGNQTLRAIGEEDIFVCKLKPDGEVAWAKRAGSRLEDEVAGIAIDTDNNIVLTGTYWLSGDFDAIQLAAGSNPKGIFLAKYNSDGQILWAESLNGSGLKGTQAIICDADKNILLTGYFEDSLQIADTTLVSKGLTDLFLAKFSPEGSLLWATRQGYKGDTRGTALGLMRNGAPVVAGFFNDSTQLADTILVANTLDQDAFVARFDKNGVPLWAKKAGGVFDSDVTALAVDAQDNIYVSGYFVGTMRLSSQISINSSSGNSDIFLLKYQSDGTPLTARALGGMLLEQALDMTLQNNVLLVTGFYQGDLKLDNFSLSTGNSLSGFIAGFDLNLQTRWLKNMASEGALYPSQIAANSTNHIWVGGSFLGKATLDNLSAAANNFDLFLAEATLQATATQELAQQNLFLVFPNPTDGTVFIQTEIPSFTVQVMNAAGQSILQGANLHMLDFRQMPKGTYFITFQADKHLQTHKIIWE